MQLDEIYLSLIVRYLKNEISDKAKHELFKWVYSDSANEKYFYTLKDIWETAKYDQITVGAETDGELETLILLALKKETENHSQRKTVKKILFQAVQIAAIAIIAFGIGFLIQKYLPEEPEFAHVNVPLGAKSHIELPDGSKVWINSGSTLKYPTVLNAKEVDIFLEGEAFFDIVKNPKRKLNVRTSTLNIQVLGTSFNVKSYNDEDVVETTLVNGSILIKGKVGNKVIDNPVLLKPNEHAKLIKSEEKFCLEDVKEVTDNRKTPDLIEKDVQIQTTETQPRLNISENIDLEKFVSWKDNKLIFKNEPLESLSIKLERWYNVSINIQEPELKKSRYTGTFENETIEQAIKALSISLPFEYKIDKNQIEIIKKKS
jgi:transmembrane sensor